MSMRKTWKPAEAERRERVRALGCMACRQNPLHGLRVVRMRITIDHTNIGGVAGQKVRGNAFVVPLCAWHHLGERFQDMGSAAMARVYGPSLHWGSRTYRATYGSDDEMLAKVAKLLGETE